MDEKVEKIVELIRSSALDETIKNILIRDLQTEGLTDFLREQIKAYCLDGLKKLDEAKQDAIKILDEKNENPSA